MATAAALGLLLTACLELEETVAIRPDGSGSHRLRMAMTQRGLALAEALRDRDAATPPPPTVAEAFDARVLRQRLTEAGLRCRSLHSYREGGSRRLEVAAEFSDLTELQQSPLRGGQAEWRFERGGGPNEVRVVLFPRGEEAWRAAFAQARALDDEPTQTQRETFRRARAELDGLLLHWTLELPGPVLNHSRNLRRVDGSRVEAIVTAGDINDLRDLLRHTAPRYEVTFDATGCAIPLDPAPRDDASEAR